VAFLIHPKRFVSLHALTQLTGRRFVIGRHLRQLAADGIKRFFAPHPIG
jgi:hypothetical protein